MPDPIEPGVPAVQTHLAVARGCTQCATCRVLGKYPGYQLPEPACFTRVDQALQRGTTRSHAPCGSFHVHGELSNAGVTWPAAVFTGPPPRLPQYHHAQPPPQESDPCSPEVATRLPSPCGARFRRWRYAPRCPDCRYSQWPGRPRAPPPPERTLHEDIIASYCGPSERPKKGAVTSSAASATRVRLPVSVAQ